MDQPEDHETIAELLEEAAVLMLRHLTGHEELSLTAAATLSRLNRQGPQRLTALAASEGIAQPSMTQLIQRLERQGLVARTTAPEDGRVVLVEITDAGRDLIARRHAARVKRLTALLATLPPEQRQALTAAAQTALPAVRQLIHNVS